jgi:trk system potassium uptake protein TrkA
VRVAIAGAGAVGRSIAQRLVDNGHKVLLIERQRSNYQPRRVPGADWMFADACEIEQLRAAGIETCDVVAATAGSDQVNLVFALLAKTEFAVPRVVARVSNPSNQWLFTVAWGVDVAVDTPTRLVAAVEEAVAVGEVVSLKALARGLETIVEVRLPSDTALAGSRACDLVLPSGARVVSIVRENALVPPVGEARFEQDDEIVLVVRRGVELEVRDILTARAPAR